MRELFIEYLQSSSQETYHRVRNALITSDSYSPYSTETEEIQNHLEAGNFKRAIAAFQKAMPNLLLSPRAHMLASMAYKKLGKQEEAKMEATIYWRCIDGILSTGDGTRERPYAVTRVSDEYDILLALEKEMVSQALCEINDRHCDVITLADGGEIVFDIADYYKALSRQFSDR